MNELEDEDCYIEIPHGPGDTIVGTTPLGNYLYIFSSNGWAYEVGMVSGKPTLTGKKYAQGDSIPRIYKGGPSVWQTGPSRYTNGVMTKKRDTNRKDDGKDTL